VVNYTIVCVTTRLRHIYVSCGGLSVAYTI